MANKAGTEVVMNGSWASGAQEDDSAQTPPLRGDWSQQRKHTEALSQISQIQNRIGDLRVLLPAILHPLAHQTSDAAESTTSPAAVYAAFEAAAVRMQDSMRDLKSTWDGEGVRDVLKRVQEREEGTGDNGVFGDLEGPNGWELVVGRSRWAAEGAMLDVVRGENTK